MRQIRPQRAVARAIKPMRGHDGVTPPRGFALVIVLWAMGLLALLGAQLTSTARVQMRLAMATRDRAQAEAAADGAIRQAVFVLLSGRQQGVPVRPMRFRIGTAMVDLTMEDEATKINPNSVPPETMRALLVAVGVDQPRAALLAAEMADWRRRSLESSLGGAKIDQYREHGLPYRSGDHPFVSIAEIGLLPDMTPEILARLRPWLSVYQEGATQDPGGTSPVGSAMISARASTQHVDLPQFKSDNLVVRVTARAVEADGAQFTRSAVVRIRVDADDEGPLFQVLSWN